MIFGFVYAVALAATGSSGAARPASTLARGNLHAWAFEEYDAIARSPQEHARVLKEIGLTKAGYICRNAERVAVFEDYIKAYRREGIELVAVWTPVHTEKPFDEVQIRAFLDVAARHQLRAQWWLTLEGKFDTLPVAERVPTAVARLRPLVAEGNRRGLKVVLYGHGRAPWFSQAENEIAILERLRQEMPSADVGIVYSFHQSFAQMDRFGTVFPRLKPWLAAVNLNALGPNAKAGTPVGEGSREKDLIETIYRSGWFGPVGILSHNRANDAKANLRENLEGLAGILRDIGDTAGAASY